MGISSLLPRFSLFSAKTAPKLVGPKKPAVFVPREARVIDASLSLSVLGLAAVEGKGVLVVENKVALLAGKLVPTCALLWLLPSGLTTALEPVVGVSGKEDCWLPWVGSDCLLLMVEFGSVIRVIGALM
jgi:hypothetical protein